MSDLHITVKAHVLKKIYSLHIKFFHTKLKFKAIENDCKKGKKKYSDVNIFASNNEYNHRNLIISANARFL